GDEMKSQKINARQITLPVTKNCGAALQLVRSPYIVRRVWIDSICIDQVNVLERNHQVGLMKHICSSASEMNICISVLQHDYSECIQSLGQVKDWLDEETCERTLRLKHLFHRRYFGRAWVVQEAVLA
ncbi:uncharacterized protein M421DRAFT_69240, partial [Didymella exigua CBS 183.55]